MRYVSSQIYEKNERGLFDQVKYRQGIPKENVTWGEIMLDIPSDHMLFDNGDILYVIPTANYQYVIKKELSYIERRKKLNELYYTKVDSSKEMGLLRKAGEILLPIWKSKNE